MRTLANVIGLVLLLGVASVATAQEGPTHSYSVWFGANWTEATDYQPKISEFGAFGDDVTPELGINYLSIDKHSVMRFDGYFIDKQNIWGKLNASVADVFKAKVMYRGFTRNLQQDLLANAEAREFLGYIDDPENPGTQIQRAGGKMLTHELQDEGVEYAYDRDEILSRFELLLSRKHDVRLVAAHRAILQKGNEQKIASNHCFSCHLTSQEAQVDKKTHALEAGLEAEAAGFDFGYTMGYRSFKSEAPDVTAYYDPGKHPVHGGAGAEFSSRVWYDDSTVAYDTEPETEKISHKLRFKGDLGKGRFATSLTYSRAENKLNDLASKVWSGSINYTHPISPKMRLIARGAVTSITTDDTLIDVPVYREGRPGPAADDFDFVRYSSLDRDVAKGSAELITRLNPKMNLSVMGGLEWVDRDNYLTQADVLTSTTMFGQLKLRYRKGLRYSASVKYRLEMTSDPFVNGKGLFERSGRTAEEVWRPMPGFAFIHYYQREQLRYQMITTQPTQAHIFEWRSTWRPDMKTLVNVGIKGSMDKNDDLDSLDVENLSYQPNLSLTYTPTPQVSVTAGYTYDFSQSRGPVTVALFDG